MVSEIPPQNYVSQNSHVINLRQFKLQRLQTKYSMHMTNLAIIMESKCRNMSEADIDKMVEEIKKDEALLDSIKSAMELEYLLKKEQEAYEAQKKADIKKALKELTPKFAEQ